MKKKEFFKVYIWALEKALENDNINHGYMVSGPEWYIDDQDLRNQMDLFEESNFERYRSLFEKVAIYFDAKSHYFNEIGQINIEKYKDILQKEILAFKKKFDMR